MHDRGAGLLGEVDRRLERSVGHAGRARVGRVVEVERAHVLPWRPLEIGSPARRRVERHTNLARARERGCRGVVRVPGIGKQDRLAPLDRAERELDERRLRAGDDGDLARGVELDAVQVAVPRSDRLLQLGQPEKRRVPVDERRRLERNLVEPLHDMRRRPDVRVPAPEIDDGLAVLRLSGGDASEQPSEVLLGQAVEPFGAGAHRADLLRRGRKSHLAARSCPAHDFEVDDEALVLRSAELAEAGDWGTEALAVNRALVDHHPDAAGARYRLAVCLEEAGEFIAARAAYARFLERRAEGTEARTARRRLAILRERARAASAHSPYQALGHARKHAREGDLDGAMVWPLRARGDGKRPTAARARRSHVVRSRVRTRPRSCSSERLTLCEAGQVQRPGDGLGASRSCSDPTCEAYDSRMRSCAEPVPPHTARVPGRPLESGAPNRDAAPPQAAFSSSGARRSQPLWTGTAESGAGSDGVGLLIRPSLRSRARIPPGRRP